jgi:hypothetical protein
VRGVLDAARPDAVTWGLVFGAAEEPERIVVVDARTGGVARRLRG